MIIIGTGDVENLEEDLTIVRECDLFGIVSEFSIEASFFCEEVSEKIT